MSGNIYPDRLAELVAKIDAEKAREAILAKPPKTPPRAPGRVANVFRRRGQWSLAWWGDDFASPDESGSTKGTRPKGSGGASQR